MPMNRYEIRNEYSLADPELYRAADKDDPEALLEGVAMAGLVGVLRQLGDLAEFAAEIFHDLHEEVMATAARGHSLMIRVQQLEAEVPSIEKAFLSQTDHQSFFYSAGVDWHPNLRVDQNLVTQGDLPRFVMDSYEECRGPPRLFLLDKFDVAGAGACLKRYTDPSFFKVETSAMANADVQREKKIRRAKKKGARGRYGETPEVLLASHAKLHQLFLEEPDENAVGKPSHRAKLKRRPNAFPFDSKTGRSYMEKLLRTPSPEHKMLHEITASSPLRISTNYQNESDLDELDLRSVNPDRESEGRKINPPPPDTEDTMRNPFMNQTNDESTDFKICEVPSYLNIVTDDAPSSFDEENCEKDITAYGESKTVGNLTDYQSDEIASEIGNYVDAPSTMLSEMDTDAELKVKKDFTSSYIKSQPFVSVKNEKHIHSQSSDSQSTGDLTISDEGSNSCKKEVSSFLSSDSSRTSAENPQSEKLSAVGFPSLDIPEIAIANTSSYQSTADEKFSGYGFTESVVSNTTFRGKGALPNIRPDFEQLNSDLSSSNSIAILPHYDSGGAVQKGRTGPKSDETASTKGPKSDETASTSVDEEKKTNLIIDTSCSRSVAHSKSLSGDDSPRSTSGEHREDGENALCTSTATDIICHTPDSSAAISAYLLHEDDNALDDLNQFGNMTSTTNMGIVVLSQNRIDTEEIISKESPTLSKLDNEATKFPDNFASDSIDMVHNRNDMTSMVPEGEKQNDDLYNDSNVDSDAANRFSCIMESSIWKEFRDTSFSNAETVDFKDLYYNGSIVNEISSETLILSGIEDCPDLPEADLDANGRDFIPEKATTVNEIPEPGTPKSCEVVGLLGTGIGDDVTPNDLLALESSSCTPENLEDPAGTSDTAEKDGINPDCGVTGLELTEISSSSGHKSLSEEHELLDDSNSNADQSETAVMACSLPAVSDNTIRENVSLPAGLDKLVEEHSPCFEDSGLGEHENEKTSLSESDRESELVKEEKNYLLGIQGQSGLVEEVDEREAGTLDHHTVICSTDNNDHPISGVPHMVSNSYLDSEVEHIMNFVDTAQFQSPLEQRGLDTNKEPFQRSGVENQVSDANSLPIDLVTEETMLQEKIELPLDRIDQELPDSGEISSELSSPLPINHQETLDHDNNKGDENFASLSSLVNYPPSVLGLSGLRNYGVDVSAYPKNPSGFIFPPSNFFSDTNQTNLDELPPLPPLPPLQWRMGKIQQASSTADIDKIEHEEVSSQQISPPAASTGNVSPSLEQMNHSPIQILPQILIKEGIVEHSSLSLEANSVHETIDLPPNTENEQQGKLQHASSTTEINKVEQKEVFPQEISPPAASTDNFSSSLEQMNHPLVQIVPQISLKEENVEHSSPSLEANSIHETINLPPKIENEQRGKLQYSSSTTEVDKMERKEVFQREISPPAASTGNFNSSPGQMNHSPIQIVPQVSLKEENVEDSSPSLEANSVHETIDLPPKLENEQPQLVMSTQKSEVTPPAEEDGVANESRTVKLQRPCNPIIGSAVALDKSKLRKVTERERPQIQKPDERDSLLEQIRAKSFNLKPTAASRPSTQGPETNLKVAAILEKANAIRQALAGSDEDDDDNWSDS